MPQERRSYSKSFKAQVIAECAQPDTSIANVALTHNLNANLVHKWIRVHAQKTLALQTAFIPVKAAPAVHQVLSATIRIEVPHSKGVVVVSWPTENAASCSAFLRDLLR
ncbi:ISPpu14-like transposase, Orf1 [Pseudomonas fluorescens Q2-87]|uniref:ISPpu14-like transposase, Orf1 n=1 Tax=Pseudomonas fluorescens (strain Q2-87) TaxID=1038922 RepID=J2F868_PSEFQ|nr:transposase [Pseudomonas fluorescens]EJL01881.1 ISPpu14-like transposase, Orf1 [Pseudomonas fluorescens Q2-87]EJL02858.1 ISPpu14-like transposase, Orf1 [Pseudomonas fluorescens Q2-87]EJL04586.1 ISPpu14-like transposase, Orf1 [Pseudomonas fluorescens Q2-87]EJL05338.1 ISPpu14-like transposase, Orf1 [Pseudomonas fluorescens Q2-87]